MQKAPFKPTKASLFRFKNIMESMREKSFHDHVHILYDLRNSIDKETVTYLEIGAYAGGSASLMMSNPKGITNVYSIDLGVPIPKEIVMQNVESFKNPKNTFKYYEGNSQAQHIIGTVKAEVKEVDILFIDGDHTHAGVMADFHNYKDLVLPGGYIVFDDYNDSIHSPEVKKAVDDLMLTDEIKNNYTIIGDLEYDELALSNVLLERSNEFIIQKNDTSKPNKVNPPTQKINTPVKGNTSHKGNTSNEPQTNLELTSNLERDMVGFPLFLLNQKLKNLQQKESTKENSDKIKQLQRSIIMLKAPYQ